MIAAQSFCLAVPAALIGVPPLIAELSQKSILQPPNTLTPKWDLPTLGFLWSLVLGIRMPLTKACRITPCGVTTLKANGFALGLTVSAPINMNQLESSGINHFKRNNLPGPSQLKPSKYWANSHKMRSKTRQNGAKNSRILTCLHRAHYHLQTCPFFGANLGYPPSVTLTEQITQLAKQAKAASRELGKLSAREKDECLSGMAEALEKNADAIKEANALDMEGAASHRLPTAMLDRLKLDDKRISAMAQGLREVMALPDPVGKILDERIRPNGLKLQKISTPIGVVVIIYESRPNVTADAASLCFKSGNATILRGGKEALHSNQLIARLMIEAGKKACARFPEHAIQVVPMADREAIPILLGLTQYVDLCMPRGGEGLIRAVAECSKVPVIKHYKGVCHVFVDAEADLQMAEKIAMNAKVQRPAVCNSVETLLVDKKIAGEFLPQIGKKLAEKKVELRCDPAALSGLSALNGSLRLKPAAEQDWFTEYNDYILNVRVVDGVNQAIDHINYYGSAHSDSIVTRNESHARQFLNEVDSATVYWNASTRFTDGGEYGMGAEIGISTDKIGARGPMGLAELTSYKWIGIGDGQVRT
jgi:glutamate-5-semialdehyde dehydrogenase